MGYIKAIILYIGGRYKGVSINEIMIRKPIILISALFLLLFSCKKQPIVDLDENFIGSWLHNIDESHSKYLIIENDSRGFIEDYENGSPGNATQIRKWLSKKNTLYFGWLAANKEKFSIDQPPSIANNIIINNFDTVNVNDWYMILDGNYYVN